MQIVADGNAHIGLRQAILVRRDTGNERDICEFSRAVALVQVVRLAVVCDKQIELSVIVEIQPNGCQAISPLGIVDSRFFRYIGKGSVSAIVVKTIGRSLQPARTALEIDSQVLA